MIEVIFHGRGGQGGITCSELFAESAFISGKFPECSAYPEFGTERRGSPTRAYCRISKEKIWVRSNVTHADITVMIDPLLLNQGVIDQLKAEGSLLLVNTSKTKEEIHSAYNFTGKKNVKIGAVDLFKISKKIGLLNSEKQPVVNTSILGALIAMDPELGIKIDALAKSITNRFGINPKSELNIKAAQIAAEKLDILEV